MTTKTVGFNLLFAFLCLSRCIATGAATDSRASVDSLEDSQAKMRQVKTDAASTCSNVGVHLQVLGSGGPELDDGRASSAYLIWVDGKAKVMVDVGSSTALHFEKAQARFTDLDMILLSHLHVDHSADLPALIKASHFVEREAFLPVVGPHGNSRMPDTESFISRLFAQEHGAYQYLGNYLATKGAAQGKGGAYHIVPKNYAAPIYSKNKQIVASAVPVTHGPIPALAWRLDIHHGSESIAIAFSGDMASASDRFDELIDSVDWLVAHHAIPESATGVARQLHMPPSQIAAFANTANVKHLVLSHHMQRSYQQLQQSLDIIAAEHEGPIYVASDLACYSLTDES